MLCLRQTIRAMANVERHDGLRAQIAEGRHA
jgi:hypothetical protein